MIRKFLTSVADVYGYGENDEILFTGKTLIDSSMEVSLGSAPVRGGRGNQLQYIYYHTGEMMFTLTDTQWNLGMIASTIGEDINQSTNTYKEVTVDLTSSTGGSMPSGVTPLAFSGSGTVYGWATTADGSATYRVSFTSGTPYTFATLVADGSPTLGSIGQKVCVRFYALNSAAQYVTVKANIIPKVVKLVMETQLNSADVTSNKIGKVQIIAPSVTLSGAFTLSMTSDGVSNTPLTATALAYNGPAGTDACASEPYYARIIEIIDSANWYDNVIALAIEGGNFVLASGTKQLQVWAVPASGTSFVAPLADLTFSSGTTGNYTVGANSGLVTAVGSPPAGTSLITAVITAKTSIEASATASPS